MLRECSRSTRSGYPIWVLPNTHDSAEVRSESNDWDEC